MICKVHIPGHQDLKVCRYGSNPWEGEKGGAKIEMEENLLEATEFISTPRFNG